jgi:hypothetical protein
MTNAGGLLQSLVTRGIVASANADKAMEQLHRD